ncbi:PrsW family intramembrane metalloprotease [Fulvivirga imtechensis]|nr:PrsW family intramembrane metalloprotease [Fulvivirga imtechensis]
MQFLILNFFYLALILLIVKKWIYRIKNADDIRNVILSRDAALLLILLIIGFGPVYLLNNDYIPVSQTISRELQLILSIAMALLISGIWLMYVRKIDIYESEKWKYVITVFVLGAVSTELALMGYKTLTAIGIDLNGQIINDLIYCIFAIGGLEETVKIIPFLLLLKFTRAIDEPYDYILYPSISALGFAFVENIYYIDSSSLYNIGGRALYSTVAHMAFSSIIGYGMLLGKYRNMDTRQVKAFFVFFGLAMLAHGFYDFWIINYFVSSLSFLTTLFFLITIHIWFILKNNAINISTFYDPKVMLDNDRLKWYLVISLSSILMLGYVIVSIVHGLSSGNEYLTKAWLAYGYLVLYLTLSFSRYRIIKGHIGKLTVPMDFFIPKPVRKE